MRNASSQNQSALKKTLQKFMVKLIISLASILLVAYSYAVADDTVTGNLDVWDDIFASREYEVLVHAEDNDLYWTEGPVLVTNNSDGAGGDYEATLFFSEVIAAKTYSLDVGRAIKDRTKGKHNGTEAIKNISDKLHVVKLRSGDSPLEDDNWRAEPGGNGLAAVRSQTPIQKLVMCQHGARRLAMLNLDTGITSPLASDYEGRRFNGPNDVELKVQ